MTLINRRSLLRTLTASLLARPAVGVGIGATMSSEPERKDARADQLLVVYRSGIAPEEIAASELARFVQRMTGKLPEVVDEARSPVHPGGRVLALVGRTARTAEFIRRNAVGDPRRENEEAYIVRSLEMGKQKMLVFLGGNGRATLYAIYDYLTSACGLGFYWDGDYVPARSTLPISGINIATQPRFSDRIYGNGCLWLYSDQAWWRLEEWQKYIDWILKNRFNAFLATWTPGANATWEKTWAKFGIQIPDRQWSGPPALAGSYAGALNPPGSGSWRDGQAELWLQIVKWARSRGLRLIAPHINGRVPEGFSQRYPNVPLLGSRGAGGVSGGARYMLPRSPMYLKVGRAFLEEFNSRFGTDHLYHLANLGELTVAGNAQAKQEFMLDLPRRGMEVVESIDPKGVGIIDCWTFLGKEWEPRTLVRKCVEQLPRERVRVLDFWSEQQPLYKATDYFWGYSWQFGTLGSFGGQTNLHGDMPLLQAQLQAVARERQASQCTGFALVNEVSGFNYFYFQFACTLGWNPDETDITRFTREYAERRYGERAAPLMQKALEELLASVYGPSTGRGDDSFSRPLYWHRIEPRFHANVYDGIAFIPHLRRAVEYALKASEAARDNRFYQHDLNDITRAYLHQLFNARLMKMVAAFRRLDARAFKREVVSLAQILDGIEELLSLDDHYWLAPVIRLAKSLPGAPSDIARRVRNVLTVWTPGMRDYACRDLYEMVRFYYRPRVNAYVAGLRRELLNGQRSTEYQPEEVVVTRDYETIERKWVEQGFPLVERKANPQQVVDSAKKILAAIPNEEGYLSRI